MAERPNKKIKLEAGETRKEEPLPSTPDKHGGVELIDKAICIEVGRGDEQETFDLHKGFLRHYSGFFRRAIEELEEKKQKKGSIDSIELPRNWMYSPTHQLSAKNEYHSNIDTADLIQLWCFADRLEIPMLQNLVIDIIIRRFQRRELTLRCSWLDQAYHYKDGLTHLANLLAWRVANFPGAVQSKREYHMSCLAKLSHAVTLQRLQIRADFATSLELKRNFDPCVFHEHEPNVNCGSGRKGWTG
ncbi:Putative SKP1/BTB/POZ domain superfamily protein [Septoria linicola]|uniref:SKP1/BTB/POZ domain superfamily protein n=1 Tax=Septoria linicola TaxID=215465 RepID=A0A9Q9ANX2_9PEZI|nr:Putative SKP1/BTB/POZ domain superfamily protein [Septoria linicola]